MAAYKAKSMESISAVSSPWVLVPMAYLIQPIQSAQIVLHIEREMALHLEYCASFGLSKQEMENQPETIGMVLCS